MAVKPIVSILTPVRAKSEQEAGWLAECLASVQGQTSTGWEQIVVNDHSPASLETVRKQRWPNVRWLEATHQGVSAARNQAAEAAQGELLLPLDADDKLAKNAVAQFLDAWQHRDEESGIIYSDVMLFGRDYARVYLAPPYNFRTLLEATFMTVGCLHRKADWERVGGWRLDMTKGLEDWEYWIALGEIGVCGERVPEPLYWYRRHPAGRLQWLKANQDKWDRAYLAMRQLHIESYSGRYPMGCCGGSRTPRGARRPLHGGVPRPQPAGGGQAMPTSGLVQMVYLGTRLGSFQLMATETRRRYLVPGAGGLVEEAETGRRGVHPQDVGWFRSINQGRDFRVVEEPARISPVAAQPPPKPAEPAPKESEAWDTGVMEEGVEEKPSLFQPMANLDKLTVKEIRARDWDPKLANELIAEEKAFKNRKTVIAIFEALA